VASSGRSVSVEVHSAHLWTLDPRGDVAIAAVEDYLPLLSESERERMARFVGARRRLHYLLGHGLARTALSTLRPEVLPVEWDITAGPAGQPIIAGPDSGPVLCLSLSHTDTLLACLVTDATGAGVDVEGVSADVDVRAVAGMSLTAIERHRLETLPEADRRVELYRYWTLKEAFSKACGGGLSAAIIGHTFHLGGPGVAVQPPGQREIARDWCFAQWQLASGEIIAVALRHRADRPAYLIQHVDLPARRRKTEIETVGRYHRPRQRLS
jgi:4'-phosphopantetheinyl transferase